MRSRLSLKIVLVAAAASVLAGARAVPAQDLGIDVGKRAPSALVTTLDGKRVDIGQYVGKTPMFLEFWATWCPRCRDLEPATASGISSGVGAGGMSTMGWLPSIPDQAWVKAHCGEHVRITTLPKAITPAPGSAVANTPACTSETTIATT